MGPKWEVVIGGYFYDTFSIDGTQLVSNGFMDSFAARYDYQTDTWTGVNSFGSIEIKMTMSEAFLYYQMAHISSSVPQMVTSMLILLSVLILT